MFGCIGLFVSMILLIVAKGAITVLFWGWFIVPIFNAPPINIASALGIVILVTFLTKGVSHKKTIDEDIDEIAADFFKSAVQLAGFLGLGWITHLFM